MESYSVPITVHHVSATTWCIITRVPAASVRIRGKIAPMNDAPAISSAPVGVVQVRGPLGSGYMASSCTRGLQVAVSS